MTIPPLFTSRSSCRSCGSKSISTIMDYGDMPLAGGFVDKNDPRRWMTFPLILVRCNVCTLLQTRQDINPNLMFSQYSYISGSSPALVDHFRFLAHSLTNKFPTRDRVYIDVGCNDGTLIQFMNTCGVKKILGVDPSDVALTSSTSKNFDLVNEYLIPEIADLIVAEHGKSSLITACNVLAHNPDPRALVESLRILLEDDGVLVVEVHYQGSLLRDNQFDTVYHEHTCYYSLRSLIELFKEYNLDVWNAHFIANHGGSIRVYASPIGHRRIVNNDLIDSILKSESEFDWSYFEVSALKIREELINQLVDARLYSIWGYGASGRGTILLNWCNITPQDISIIVDKSPIRVGKIVPGVCIPIQSTDVIKSIQPEIFLVTAWNYIDSIVRQHPTYKGKWLLPFPKVRYL